MRISRVSLAAVVVIAVSGCNGGESPAGPTTVNDIRPRFEGIGWTGSGGRITSDTTNTEKPMVSDGSGELFHSGEWESSGD
jgi:hypothetical protein